MEVVSRQTEVLSDRLTAMDYVRSNCTVFGLYARVHCLSDSVAVRSGHQGAES